MRRVSFLATAVLAALLAVPASAQNPPEGIPAPVRGTVERLEGGALLLKSRDGQPLTIALAPNVTVFGMARKSIDDVLTGDYVAAIGVRDNTGKMHAVEVRIYPESMQGLRAGQAPSNVPPGSLTTHARVANITKASDGQILSLTFRGGGADYIAGSDVPVFTYVPGDASLLKPGAAVYVTALKRPDGSMIATQLIAERDGIKPPS